LKAKVFWFIERYHLHKDSIHFYKIDNSEEEPTKKVDLIEYNFLSEERKVVST
jgi:hypothetical protein